MKFPCFGIDDLQCATLSVHQLSRLNAWQGHHTCRPTITCHADMSPVDVYDWPHLLLGLIIGVLASESRPLAYIYTDDPIDCLVAAIRAFIRSSSVFLLIVHVLFT